MPRVRLDGGVIGSLNTPSLTSAGGIWTLKDNEEYTRRGLWPAASFPVNSVNAAVLLVAGGGAGGMDFGGGGGAGGVIQLNNYVLSYGNLSLPPYTAIVGAGGAGPTTYAGLPSSGSNTSMFGYTAIGGGYGAGSAAGPAYAATSGGSGGGAYGNNGTQTNNGAGTVGQGNAGGTATGASGASTASGGGGGGGASAAGTNATHTQAGNGGAGIYSSISGSNTAYAGGGGGGGYAGYSALAGSGGVGGGGSGNTSTNSSGAPGTAFTGGGGGAGGGGGSGSNSNGSGGSGIVIINYAAPQYFTGGTVTNVNNLAGSNIVHTFTSSGSLTPLATPIDTYQPYNTLLLHADGTNGANNSMFFDNSANTYIPFNGTYSVYFPTTTERVTTSSSYTLAGVFTLEFFIYFPTALVTGQSYLGYYSNGGFQMYYDGTRLTPNVYGTGNIFNSTFNPSLNTWYHVVVVRNASNVMTMYVNGASVGSTTTSASYTSGTFALGNQLYYISNVRLTNTDVYGGTVTVPTSPLTSISGTQFILAQSNRFIDSSTGAQTITTTGAPVITAGGNGISKTGTPTQGTYSPFSTTGWSNYFNGSTDNLNIATTYALPTSTTSFTLECWVYPITQLSGTGILSAAYPNSGNIPFNIFGGSIGGTTGSTLSAGYYNGSSWTGIQSSTSLTLNQWSHIALSYNGTTATLYLNGTSIGTYTGAWSAAAIQSTFYVGRRWDTAGTPYFNGYISNVRFVEGTAVYTGSFTPPISPLTAISGTKWLTSQSNRFVDNSTSPLTITTSGSPQVQPLSPFNPSVAYSNTVVGGSMYFNGSTDYLTVPTTGNFDLSTATNWTIECWIYPTLTQAGYIVQNYTTSGSTIYGLDFNYNQALAGGISFGTYNGSASGADQFYLTYPVANNTWTHVAAVRNGSGTNNITLYINGAVANTGTYTTWPAPGDSTTYIGVRNYGGGSPTIQNYFGGYISNLRSVIGTSVYTSAFTPPAAPLSPIANTKVLLNATNAGIIDSSQKNQLITYGSASISTAQSKFGGSSMYFNGSSSYIYANPSQTVAFGTGDFTCEGWVYLNATATAGVFQTGTSYFPSSTTNSVALGTVSSGVWQIYAKNTNTNSVATYNTGQWYHFALVRYSGTTSLYINGTSVITVSSDTTNYTGTYLGLGGLYGGYYINAYLDDFRITNSYARYTSNFTPPTSAFLNQ
jgi:Concanavalin A-like lectin/glucanases superfamily